MLIILSVVMLGMSCQMLINNGIIRGGGNAMFVVKAPTAVVVFCRIDQETEKN